MKKIMFVLSILSTVVVQNLSCAASLSSFESQVESFLSDLDSAKSSFEKKKIRKGFVNNVKKQIKKKIAHLEALLAKYADELQDAKDGPEAERLMKKMEKLKAKIKDLKKNLLGSSASSESDFSSRSSHS